MGKDKLHLSFDPENTMSPFRRLVAGKIANEYILPLFWQHGESREVLLEEIEQMHAAGIGGMILESRPFPDFLGPGWWANTQFILAEAGKRGMKVFVFDDATFPSGFAAGRIRDRHPEYLKVYLRESHVDAVGPLRGAAFRVGQWAGADEAIVRVVLARRTDDDDGFDAGTVADVTALIRDGILYWDVPEGSWRVFIFVRTRHGGEEWTKDYLNPLDPEPVRAFIDEVYEPHFAHFGDQFGKTFAGFFSDEPRFGNCAGYGATLGAIPMVLPYSDRLINHLNLAWGRDFSTLLPCLWHDGGEVTAQARFTYMDVVTRLYGRNFTSQIGDWCRAHGVKLIGHVVEDSGAHARLGYGAGHFFRAIRGQDWSGMDAVFQIWPERTSGKMSSPFGALDMDFFYWGIAKMASSEGHLDPKKGGVTVCEAFGAYGWQEGLKFMKWLTDHLCVRGVNRLIPHAFSPKAFPDPDCPPHFYARGNNPQWRYFKIWADYANRLCRLLSDGRHVAPVAVVYHAEAEWAGAFEPFEKVVRTLAERQIDCDIVPIDTLSDPALAHPAPGALRIHNEEFRVVVVPFSEALPATFVERLCAFAESGIRIVFMRELPARSSRADPRFQAALARLRANPCVVTLDHGTLAGRLLDWKISDIGVADRLPQLRHYHYVHTDAHLHLFVNESTRLTIDTQVHFSQNTAPMAYNALTDEWSRPSCRSSGGGMDVDMCLEPYESMFIVFGSEASTESVPLPLRKDMSSGPILAGPWTISIATAKEFPVFKPAQKVRGLGNISLPDVLPSFSGTVRYETDFAWTPGGAGERVFLDLGEVYEIAAVTLNDCAAGVRIAPPYRMEVTALLRAGANRLQIDVTNTLAKQCGNNQFDRAMPQEPSGLIGPVQVRRLVG